MTRVRYAPSPTGELHLGSLRTVIYDWLVARQSDGVFIMRVEDTDQARLVEGSLERQLQDLAWMGLTPDEGVYLDEQGKVAQRGEKGPYIQSQRLDIYKKYADELLEKGHAYRCFATPEELEQMRTEQQARGEIPHYDRRYRDLPRAESDKRAEAGEKFVIRHALPLNQEVKTSGVIRGVLSFNTKDLDDYVLLKSDGFPTYQLANVVDDHLMEISLVIRGEEWISSLPKNILLYEAFGWKPPEYAHVPVILGPDGRHKLSKRDGDVNVAQYRERGYLPDALFNMLTFLGWSPGTEEEFFTRDELIRRFTLNRVQKAPAKFDFDRLDYVNGWYIRKLTVGEVATEMLPYLLKAGIKAEPGNFLLSVAASVQERLKHFDEAPDLTRFYFERPKVDGGLQELIVPKKSDLPTTMEVLKRVTEYLETISGEEWTIEHLEERLRLFIAMGEYSNMAVLWPIRAALTGLSASPGAFEVLHVLGCEESIARLRAVVAGPAAKH
jgi:nondiscriminating glutamyl-tRNA synthetase